MATSTRMITREHWRKLNDHPIAVWSMFTIGVLLLVISPLVGAIPGPGGIVVAGIGLALILKTSVWARRRYVKFKRWQPKAGRWTDWALRRRSAKRRLAMLKQRETGAEIPTSPPSTSKPRGPRTAAQIAREWDERGRSGRRED
jgi:hypothetical protein